MAEQQTGAPGAGEDEAPLQSDENARRHRRFDVVPAIDLRGGQVVRLEQGDFAAQTAYAVDPLPVARSFAQAGASWLHLVDLDGARAGIPVQLAQISAIVQAVGSAVACQVAGGLRTAAAVEAAFATGAARVVLGTAALRNVALVAELVSQHGRDRVAVALDVRDGRALGDAWVADAAGVAVEAALERLVAVGVGRFVVTAVERDGLLGGPDLALLRRVVRATPATIIASGGIASLSDLEAVRAAGCRGAIVGRALYEGRLDISTALAWAGSTRGPDGWQA